MAFPASTQTQADALEKVRSAAIQLKKNAQQVRDKTAAGSVEASIIISLLNAVRETIIVFDDVAAIPGIDAYVQAQYDDNALDVSAEFSAMRAEAVNVKDWIVANIPIDTDGYVLLQSFDADGKLVWREFTSAQTSDLRTQLDNLIATIG